MSIITDDIARRMALWEERLRLNGSMPVEDQCSVLDALEELLEETTSCYAEEARLGEYIRELEQKTIEFQRSINALVRRLQP